jgi:hypothetical protein
MEGLQRAWNTELSGHLPLSHASCSADIVSDMNGSPLAALRIHDLQACGAGPLLSGDNHAPMHAGYAGFRLLPTHVLFRDSGGRNDQHTPLRQRRCGGISEQKGGERKGSSEEQNDGSEGGEPVMRALSGAWDRRSPTSLQNRPQCRRAPMRQRHGCTVADATLGHCHGHRRA